MMKTNLLEKSITRIWRDNKECEFGIIPLWQMNSTEKLKAEIHKNGLVFVGIDAMGHKEINGIMELVKEPLFLIKHSDESAMRSIEFEAFLIKLAVENQQKGIVFYDTNNGTHCIVLKKVEGNSNETKVKVRMNDCNPAQIADFFSLIKEDEFILEGFKYADRYENFIHGMILKNTGQVDLLRGETREEWLKMMGNHENPRN